MSALCGLEWGRIAVSRVIPGLAPFAAILTHKAENGAIRPAGAATIASDAARDLSAGGDRIPCGKRRFYDYRFLFAGRGAVAKYLM